jgi:Arc/MetJ family transcription regulator
MSKGSVEIDDRLIREAQKLSGLRTKRAVVNAALEFLVRYERLKKGQLYPARVDWKNKTKS